MLTNLSKGIIVLFLSFGLFAVIGEIKCVIKFIQCDFEAPYKAEIIYGLSIPTGVGCITGWFNFGEFSKSDASTHEIIYPVDSTQLEPLDTLILSE